MEEKFILIDNLKVNYKIAGQGPAILVLHGWGGSSDSWETVQELLANSGYKVFVPDLPGFGKSAPPADPWGVSDYMEWLNIFIEKAGIPKKFFLLGHSFGGRIAIKFSIKSSDRIEKLILLDSAGIKPKPGLKSIIVFILARLGNAIFTPKHLNRFKDSIQNLFYKIVRNHDYANAKGVMRETIKKVLDEDLLSELPKIDKETLIVWGESDKMVPLVYGHIFNEKIKNSSLKVLPGIGHSPHLETAKELSKIILNFFK